MTKNIIVLANNYKWFHEAVRQRFSPDRNFNDGREYELQRLSPSNQRTLTTIEKDGTVTRYRYADSMRHLQGLKIDGVRVVIPYSRQTTDGAEMLDYLSAVLKEDVRNNHGNFWHDENSPEGIKQIRLSVFEQLGD